MLQDPTHAVADQRRSAFETRARHARIACPQDREPRPFVPVRTGRGWRRIAAALVLQPAVRRGS